MRIRFMKMLLGVCLSVGVISLYKFSDKIQLNFVRISHRLVFTASNRLLSNSNNSNNNNNINNHSFANDSHSSLLTVTFVGRLGNQMFEYASLLGLAEANRRIPFVPPDSTVAKTFHVTKTKINDSISSDNHQNKRWIHTEKEKHFGIFDPRLQNLPPGGNLKIHGFLQSYRYFENITDSIRSEFRFLPPIREKADFIINQSLLTSKRKRFGGGKATNDTNTNTILIGVHVRRGDMLSKKNMAQGYKVPTVGYFKKALDLMRKKYHYKNVLFLIASTDRSWVETSLKAEDDDVAMLPDANAKVHMCVLARCDHVIMSVGTYGWWAGFLAGGDVIYFNQPFVPGSFLDKHFDAKSHFPNNWIGLN